MAKLVRFTGKETIKPRQLRERVTTAEDLRKALSVLLH